MLLRVVAWPAQSLSVYTFTIFGGVTISIKLFALGAPFKYLTIRFKFIPSLSHDVCSFLEHVQHFPTTVLYIARLSLSSSTSDSVVGVGVTGFASSKPRTVITSRMYIGVASTEYPRALCSITLPKKKIFCHPASPFFL